MPMFSLNFLRLFTYHLIYDNFVFIYFIFYACFLLLKGLSQERHNGTYLKDRWYISDHWWSHHWNFNWWQERVLHLNGGWVYVLPLHPISEGLKDIDEYITRLSTSVPWWLNRASRAHTWPVPQIWGNGSVVWVPAMRPHWSDPSYGW